MKAANRVWEIAYPILMYYATIMIGITIAQMILGTGNESYLLCKTLASIAAISVVYQDYKNDRIMSGRWGQRDTSEKKELRENWMNILAIIGITLCLSIAFNNILSMSPLVHISSEYEDASNALYGSGNLGLELLGSALVTPILEEMLHRGVIYGRLRRYMGMWTSVLLSSFIFGVLHFNIVQFIYALLLGIVFAVFMEKTKRLYAPVLAHIVANAFAVIRTETGILLGTVDGSVFAWSVSIGLLLVGSLGVWLYIRKEVK